MKSGSSESSNNASAVRRTVPSSAALLITGAVKPLLLIKSRYFRILSGNARAAVTRSSYSSIGIGRFVNLHSQNNASVLFLLKASRSTSSCARMTGFVPHHFPICAGINGSFRLPSGSLHSTLFPTRRSVVSVISIYCTFLCPHEYSPKFPSDGYVPSQLLRVSFSSAE